MFEMPEHALEYYKGKYVMIRIHGSHFHTNVNCDMVQNPPHDDKYFVVRLGDGTMELVAGRTEWAPCPLCMRITVVPISKEDTQTLGD